MNNMPNRLRVELLEDRLTPTTLPPVGDLFTVTTAADIVDDQDGVLSLREAIQLAQSDATPAAEFRGFAQIQFAKELEGKTIKVSKVGGGTYGAAAFEITRNITIKGNGQKIQREAGSPSFRLFTIVGGSSNAPYAGLSIENVELLGGYAEGFGGAIYNNGGTFSAKNSTVADNSAMAYGGAIFSVGGSNYITNSTLSNNTTRPNREGVSAGGAVYAIGDAEGRGWAYFMTSTLADNVARAGAQVYTNSIAFSAINSVFYTASSKTDGAADAEIINNLIVRTAELREPDRNMFGKVVGDNGLNVSTADPLLGPLQDNGGPTRTRLPQPGSAAIDAATNLSFWNSRDQRGFVRGVGRKHDLGAVEAGATVDGKAYEPPSIAVGAAKGEKPEVRLYRADGTLDRKFLAYDAGFLGGVEVSMADFNADGVADIVTAAKAGGGPHVRIFDGITLKEIRGFFAFDTGFTGGLSLAMGDVNYDGVADLIVGAGQGGGPHVKVFDGKSGSTLKSFFAYDQGFRGGVNIAYAGGYSLGGIVTAAGPGGSPHVKVFQADTLAVTRSFFAYDPGFQGGVSVDYVNGHLVTGTVTGTPHVKAFRDNRQYMEGPNVAPMPEVVSFFAGDTTSQSGVAIGSAQTIPWPPSEFYSFVPIVRDRFLYTSVGDGVLKRFSLQWDDDYSDYTKPVIRTKLVESTIETPITGIIGSLGGIEPEFAYPVMSGTAEAS